MAGPASAIVVKLLTATTDSKSRETLLIALLIPIALIVIVLSLFTYKTEDANDTYTKAVEKVKEESHITNDLDGNLIRIIYMLKYGDVTESENAISEFITNNFIKEITETYVDEGGNKHTVTYNAFMAYFEILDKLKLQPFEFDNETIELVKLYELLSPGDSIENGGLPISIKFPRPCQGYVSSAYGGRVNPITGEPGAFHYGMDIRGEHYQPISSISDGIVRTANTQKSGYGNYVLIEHNVDGTKFYSLYAHLSSLLVSVGQEVHQGQVIGKEGGEPGVDKNPGDTTGHHLHFELRKTASRDSAIDPAPYIQ